jgi:hypothetical protein
MGKVDEHRAKLARLTDWEPYLLAESGLPGPRGNLELAAAFAAEASASQIRRYAALSPEQAPGGTAREFLAVCGVLGLGRFLVAGEEKAARLLRARAADPRWRVREAVAMALQTLGDADIPRLMSMAAEWRSGTFFEQRAVVAGLCEPRLLRATTPARATIKILDQITAGLAKAADRREEGFKVLRQALGYGWSVAVVALPEEGKKKFERWFREDDPDVRWVLGENLKKARLARLDPGWVKACGAQLRPAGKAGRAR